MYAHDQRQLRFHETDFSFYGMPLDPRNRWVQLAEIIPWDIVENEYIKHFTETRRGGEARSARFALGTLIIKEQLNLSDRETVQQIKENPYMQYFLGESGYDYNIPLDASSLTYFRKRFTADELGSPCICVGRFGVSPLHFPRNSRYRSGNAIMRQSRSLRLHP